MFFFHFWHVSAILVFCFGLRVFYIVYALVSVTSLTIFTLFLFQEDRTHNDVGEERIFQRTEYETQVGTV